MNATTPAAGLPPMETAIAGRTVRLHYGDPKDEYAAATTGAVVMDRSHEGRVIARGRDRVDLLHRMSTNDLSTLGSGQTRPTVLTNPLARIVDVVWALALPEHLLMITGPGREVLVRRWLSGYVFYNDDAQFEDATESIAQFAVTGPRAAALISNVLPQASGLGEGDVISIGEVTVARGTGLSGDGFTILVSPQDATQLWGDALRAGAVPAGEITFNTLRVESGRPYSGHEATEEYIPLEAGLWAEVSFSKGCYIGQEIIARMESRGKLARTLVGLTLSQPAAQNAEIFAGDLGVGHVTSAAESPRFGPIALAIVKAAHALPGTALTVGGGSAKVSALPFGTGPQ